MAVTRSTALLVVLAALVALPAFAQTPFHEATGYGFAGVSVDETASYHNPAGLPLLETFGMNVSPWPSRASLNAVIDGPEGYNEFSAFYAGRDSDRASGWGAGYISAENGFDEDSFSLGYGQRAGENLTIGASIFYQSLEFEANPVQAGGDDDTLSVDLGAMYRRQIALNDWRFGLWLEDISDEYGGPFVQVGAAVQLPAGVEIGATLWDLTDEHDTWLGLGVEWDVPNSGLILRGGAADGDLSLGAAYQFTNFEVGLSFADTDGSDDFITAGVTGSF